MDIDDACDQNWPSCRQAKSRQATIRSSIQGRRKARGISNPAFISLALVTYIIISDQSTIMSKNLIIGQKVGLDYSERSLIGLAYANPAPEPSPASGRSATSGSHRNPPINGSIFGKRSVASSRARSSGDGGGTVAYEYSQSDGLGSDSHRRQSYDEPAISNMNIHQRDQRPTTTTTTTATQVASRSEPIGYKDIITEIIEEFLALNNESNPEEASVAFCRMIVKECRQMLSAKMRRSKGRRQENRR